MTKEEVTAILGVLKTSYPRFYQNMTKQEMFNTIDLWYERFRHEDVQIVTLAVNNLIDTFSFPPTIADVKKAMRSLIAINEKTENDYWNELDKAVRNCLYNTQEVYEKLSPQIKKVIGSPAQLKEYAMSDADTFATVTKGQFLKQIKVVIDREKEYNSYSLETKQFIESYKQGLLEKQYEETNKLLGLE